MRYKTFGKGELCTKMKNFDLTFHALETQFTVEVSEFFLP